MRLLLNTATIANQGTFAYRLISRNEARDWLWHHAADAISYVGYPQTAEHLTALYREMQTSPWICPLSRAKCSMRPGDEALVCRLAYRLDNPATKGQPQAEDWEYGILQCLEEVR